jgi:hypothetical protein
MSGIDIKVQGSEELLEFFRETPKAFPAAVIREISRKGAKPILTQARSIMPLTGELGQVGKKAVIIQTDKRNKAAVNVTISSKYFSLHGKDQSIGKIIRHMTAGPQHERFQKGAHSTGRVSNRSGDFIEYAFSTTKDAALKIINEGFWEVISRKAAKAKLRG